MGLFNNIKNMFSKNDDSELYLTGLNKTKLSFTTKLKNLATGFKGIDDDFLDEILELLLESDIGFKTSEKIINQFVINVNNKQVSDYEAVISELILTIKEMYTSYELDLDFSGVLLMVGVNGAGKTTSTAKLANLFKNSNKSIAVVAADTFRAGATSQLNEWAKRIDINCIMGKDKQDPSSVITEGCRYKKDNNIDILICDTAGRLQNKTNLMNELDKMNRVIDKELENINKKVYLVMDATTGQNGISQAEEFIKTCNVDAIILTKLDGSAKGGIIMAINDILKVPVAYIGLGEKLEDLREFDIDTYLYGMFEGLINEEN